MFLLLCTFIFFFFFFELLKFQKVCFIIAFTQSVSSVSSDSAIILYMFSSPFSSLKSETKNEWKNQQNHQTVFMLMYTQQITIPNCIKNIKMSHKSKAKQSDCVHPSDHLNHDAMIITRHFHTWKTRPAKLPSINSLYSIMLLKCLKAIPKDLCQHTANTDH